MTTSPRLSRRRAGVLMRLSAVAVVSLFASWGGAALVAQADPFLAPTITSISPDHGPLSGGTLVTVTGTNFTADSSVTFDGTTAPTVTVVDSTTLTVVSPASSGSVHVIVTTSNGMIASDDTFNYYATPAVTSVMPATGPAAGGTAVSIAGSGFLSADTVTFGATSVPFTYVNDGLITAVAPAGGGTVDVQVSGPGGASATSSNDQFTYTAAVPTVADVSPSSGPTGGGTTVTVTGTNLTGATAVTFGAAPASAFTVNSATSITATAPAGTGLVDVRVTTPAGTSAAQDDLFFYVLAPTITSVSPNHGPTTGGTSVTISGTNLDPVTRVKFGATNAAGIIITDSTTIVAVAPPGTGTVDVTVISDGGTSATSAADQFSWVTSTLGLSSVSVDAGDAVTVSGSGFSPNATFDVVLHSSPVTLATVTTTATGTFSKVVTIPAGTTGGAHTIDVAGATIGLTVIAPTALARTGSDPGAPLGLAAGLLGIGLLLLGARRRPLS